MGNGRLVDALCALVALAMGGTALVHLASATDGATVTTASVGATPARLYRPADGARHPVVVIAHGFAGSQQLMQSYALTLARSGYLAVTFDFPGHGRNPVPLTGSISDVDGATRTLVTELSKVSAWARPYGDGRLAVLGHSMASDIVVRYANGDPDVTATIAVSMYSTAVTPTRPRDLLIIVGDWESTLKREALRALALAAGAQPARPFETHGDPAQGTARRIAFSPHVEHIGVLYSQASERELVAWLDACFGIERRTPPVPDDRGPWILLLLAGCVLGARPMSRLLPRIASPEAGAGLSWRRLGPALIVPMLATPLLLRVLPTHFLPVLVGDYVALHFLAYGVLTALCVARTAPGPWAQAGAARGRIALAAALVLAYAAVAIAWPVDRYVTSFMPGYARGLLIALMLPGTLAYFLADEWLVRGAGARRGAYAASKAAFVVSLAIAVALDFERLFFLIIIIPVILVFFVVYGYFSACAYRATGHPWPGALANAAAFAWAIGVTFPIVAG